jgi:MarR family transcriptional regulator, transcriptional regulator for hemolysin
VEQIRNFGFLVKDVSRLWVRLFEQRAVQLGMSLTQCKILVYVSRNEGATQARIAELSDTEPMTLVRTLDRMEGDGWIERRADPSDRRAYRIFLKPASDPVLAEIARIAEKARAEGLAGLSAEQREQMMEMLEQVRRNLTALLPAGDPAPSADPRAAKQAPKQENPRQARRATPRPTNRIRRRKATS